MKPYCPDQRLREEGWDSLSSVELLMLSIGPGMTTDQALSLAQRASRQLGSNHHWNSVSYADLRTAGLSHRRAISLLAAREFFSRCRRRVLPLGHSFRSSLEIFRYFQPRLTDLKRECFWAILLDGKNRIQRLVRISEGSLTTSLVHPREVFRPAILEAAAGVFFVHNHPSGDPAPSKEDIQVTRRLVETGKVIGIRVLDHVIIGNYRYYSFADQGRI